MLGYNVENHNSIINYSIFQILNAKYGINQAHESKRYLAPLVNFIVTVEEKQPDELSQEELRASECVIF